MQQPESLKIIPPNEQDQIRQCAAMMAETDPWISLGFTYDKCLKAFEGPCKEIYILLIEDQVAGFVILQTAGSFKGYIQTLCINKPFRNKGYGSRMLQFCEERVSKISPNLFICVSSFNKSALKLYREFGFELVGELKNFVKEGFSELLLRKTSGPLQGFLPG